LQFELKKFIFNKKCSRYFV